MSLGAWSPSDVCQKRPVRGLPSALAWIRGRGSVALAPQRILSRRHGRSEPHRSGGWGELRAPREGRGEASPRASRGQGARLSIRPGPASPSDQGPPLLRYRGRSCMAPVCVGLPLRGCAGVAARALIRLNFVDLQRLVAPGGRQLGRSLLYRSLPYRRIDLADAGRPSRRTSPRSFFHTRGEGIRFSIAQS